MPKSKAEAAAPKDDLLTTVPVVEDRSLPPVAKVASKTELVEDMEAGESYQDIDYNEPEDDKNASQLAFLSLLALALGVLGYGAYTVIDQGSANSGSASKRQVVQAVYNTYFDENEKKALIKDSKELADSTVAGTAAENVQDAS